MGLFLDDIKSHFKLDLFDKIIISAVFIISAIFCPVFASENVPISEVNGVSIPFVAEGDSGLFVSSTRSTGYILIEPGYYYTFTNNSNGAKRLAFSNSVPAVGDPFYNLNKVQIGETFSFKSSDYSYIYLDYYDLVPGVSVTREPLLGMENFIDNLTYYNGVDNLWNIFVSVIPYVSVVVLVCISLLIIRRLLSSLSKGKSRI